MSLYLGMNFRLILLFRFVLEVVMNVKEEELNSIIMELRKNIEALQEKFAKEEAAKLVGFAGQ